jgi:hypothetical protein
MSDENQGRKKGQSTAVLPDLFHPCVVLTLSLLIYPCTLYCASVDMKRKRARIKKIFKPIDSMSRPEPDEQVDDVELDHDIPEPEQATIITTEYDRDPGRCLPIWELPPDKQDDARRFYISEGPYQPILDEYEFTRTGSSRRRFQSAWFTNFSWLEYSPHTNRAYCLPCFLFSKKPIGKCGSDTFSIKRFYKWKKVNNGEECAFLTHMGTTPS